MKSKGFTTKDKSPAPVAEAKTYTRDAATDLWSDKSGRKYRLDTHGQKPMRLDLVQLNEGN